MLHSQSFPPDMVYGRFWRLGRHRLVCGDCTDPVIVAQALAGATPRLMVTDPPYGVSYDPSWREDPRLKPFVGERRAKYATGRIRNDDRAEWSAAWELFPGDVAYVWHSALHHGETERGLNSAGFGVRSQIIWDKGRLIISRGHYHWRHESCLYAVRKGRTAGWTGDRRQVTVWDIPHRRNDSGHPTQKPIDCMLRPMLNHTSIGDVVYDPFVGSGTTLLAAEQSGRSCVAIEIDPGHCERVIARWEAATGQKAVMGD
jgi:DNA modification methylase